MVSPGGELFYCKNVKSTGEHCSPLHTNSVFTLTVRRIENSSSLLIGILPFVATNGPVGHAGRGRSGKQGLSDLTSLEKQGVTGDRHS